MTKMTSCFAALVRRLPLRRVLVREKQTTRHLLRDWLASVTADYPVILSSWARGGAYLRPEPQTLLVYIAVWLAGNYPDGDRRLAESFIDRLNRDYPTLDQGVRFLVDDSLIGSLPFPGERGAPAIEALSPELAARYAETHRATLTAPDWVASLVKAFPELEPVLAGHLDAFDELIPGLFLSEVIPWLVGLYDSGQGELASSFVDEVNRSYRELDSMGRMSVREGFVYQLPGQDERGGLEISQRLSPVLCGFYGLD